jgi:hypothetical protein
VLIVRVGEEALEGAEDQIYRLDIVGNGESVGGGVTDRDYQVV